jgi:hypothetical protein
MKQLIALSISFITYLGISTAYAQTYFSCEFKQMNLGSAKVSGFLDARSGHLALSGDAILDSNSAKDKVAFYRQLRANENELKYSKYSGSTLFYFYTFSVPKNLEQSHQQNFTAFLTSIREGVDGKQDIALDCKKSIYANLINSLVREYRNLVTYDRLKPEHKKFITPVKTQNELPANILNTIRSLRIHLVTDWDFIDNDNHSPYVINFGTDDYDFDAMAINHNEKVIGYIFNVTECYIEECYGWDALYLDADGNVIYKSF